MLLVQEYLRSGKSLEQLKSDHGIEFSIINGKISLSYSQLNASNSDPLACQCRGLILRETTYDIVAAPFFRFFNHGEGTAAMIDWNTVFVCDKVDGSLLISYFDHTQNKWCVATRKRAEADGRADSSSMTFAELFDYTINYKTKGKYKNINEFMEFAAGPEQRDFTFCFEMVGPFNRIVVDYQEPDLYLLGCRDNKTLKEHNPKEWEGKISTLGNFYPVVYDLNNVEDIVKMTNTLSPLHNEGVVICDAGFNRIKVKSAAYVAYNKLGDRLSNSHKNCLEIVILEQDDDVMAMVPKLIGERILRIKNAYKIMLKGLKEDFDKIKDIENQKEFAMAAKNSLYAAPMFALRAGKTDSIDSFFKDDITPSKLTNVLSILEKIDEKVL